METLDRRRRPILWDLCAGAGGWSRGFSRHGWTCYGFDIEDEGYPFNLILGDVRDLAELLPFDWPPAPDFITASPPCTEFSRHDQPWTRAKNPAPPDRSIWQACEHLQQVLQVPMILENVRGAMKFQGVARWHCGPYYLWGDVPALFPRFHFGGKRHPPAGAIRAKSTRSSEAVRRRSMIPAPIADYVAIAASSYR